MYFSEEDLRAALRRKMPSPDFTDKVMAKVRQAGASEEQTARSVRVLHRRWPVKLFWACGAAACLLLAGVLQYRNYERQRERDRAEQQMLLAFRITDAKLNQVLRRSILERGILQHILETDSKLRREHL